MIRDRSILELSKEGLNDKLLEPEGQKNFTSSCNCRQWRRIDHFVSITAGHRSHRKGIAAAASSLVSSSFLNRFTSTSQTTFSTASTSDSASNLSGDDRWSASLLSSSLALSASKLPTFGFLDGGKLSPPLTWTEEWAGGLCPTLPGMNLWRERQVNHKNLEGEANFI